MPPLSRATVIVPPLCDFYFTRHRFSALGARIVIKLLEQSGIRTSFFPFPLMKARGTPLLLPPIFPYLQPFLIERETGKLSFFTKFRRFGPDIQTCARMIADTRPDICFFSVFAFAYADSALELADEVRRILPKVPIVMGGGGPSSFPEYFLRTTVDHVLTGEAEACLIPFLCELKTLQPELSRVPNLFWRENGSIRRSSVTAMTTGKEIEIAVTKTAESSRLTVWSTSLSRGCPMGCTFCSSHLALGKTFRTATAERVKEALSRIPIDNNSYKKQLVINIEDDNLLADDAFLRETVALIKTRFPGAEIIMENGIDYRFLTPKKTEWLIKNGMSKFNLSLGSLDPGILSSRNRTCPFEQYEQTLEILDHYHLPSVTYFICGFREDTVETVSRSLRYLAERETTIGISPFYAVPGITGCPDASFSGRPSSLCLGAACFPWNGSLSTEALITAFRLARYVNLTKDANRSEIESQLVDKIKDTRSLHTMVRDCGSRDGRIVEVERQDRELVKLFFS